MSNDVSVTIDVANQSITSSDTNIIGVPTQGFEIVTFDNKPCIRGISSSYATFTISPTIKSFSCDVFLQAVSGFTLFIEFDTVLNTKYSLVYYPYGYWHNPDSARFDSNNVLVGVWVTVTYSSTDKTITFDNGTNKLIRTIDSSIADLSIGSFADRYNIYLTNLGAGTSTRYVNKPGLAEIWANIKNYITAQLLGKSNTGHTHTKSEITDFPTIPTKTSDLTNDSGFLTSHQDLSGYVPLAGTNALAGSIVPGTDNAYDLGNQSYNFRSISARLLTSKADLNLYSSYSGSVVGSFLTLKKIDSTSSSGSFQLNAHTETTISQLIGYPNGTLIWAGKNVAMQEDTIPRSGGAVLTNYFLGRSVDTGSLMLSGGTSWSNGGSLETFGSGHSSYAGQVRLQPALSNSNFKTMSLAPNGTWTWNGAACQTTSDQRFKQQITKIDDKLLDAWGDVELVQFKYNESVDTKGKSARLHTGYVVQQIDKACKEHGVDISAYGLYCHEEYPQETEEIEVEQKDGTKTKKIKVIKEANEHYSLRYTEALIVECKYLRRCIARLTARIEELEKGNKEAQK